MRWLKGKTRYYVESECGRFRICKQFRAGQPVYLLADGEALACAGTLDACKAEAAKRAGGAA